MRMQTALYLTGTDTDAGKTYAAVALLHALRARGLRAVGMKPLASGCRVTGDGLRNADALALQAASAIRLDYADLNPLALTEPTAPEIAAALDGVTVDLAPVCHAFARLQAQAEVVVVEGVGGWMAPLSATLMQVDLVRALRLPVLLVVGLRLGCINHALLSVRALAADGVDLLGWIGSSVDPHMAYREATIDILRTRISAPCLGILPHALDPAQAASVLQIDALLGATPSLL